MILRFTHCIRPVWPKETKREGREMTTSLSKIDVRAVTLLRLCQNEKRGKMKKRNPNNNPTHPEERERKKESLIASGAALHTASTQQKFASQLSAVDLFRSAGKYIIDTPRNFISFFFYLFFLTTPLLGF